MVHHRTNKLNAYLQTSNAHPRVSSSGSSACQSNEEKKQHFQDRRYPLQSINEPHHVEFFKTQLDGPLSADRPGAKK